MRVGVSACVVVFGLIFPELDCQAADVSWYDATILAPPPPSSVLLFAGQFTAVDITKRRMSRLFVENGEAVAAIC